jgi:ABC-2 type transport system permease protein
MVLNPLTYGLAALRRCLYPVGATLGADVPALPVSLLVTSVFAVLAFLAARAMASRPLDVGLA